MTKWLASIAKLNEVCQQNKCIYSMNKILSTSCLCELTNMASTSRSVFLIYFYFCLFSIEVIELLYARITLIFNMPLRKFKFVMNESLAIVRLCKLYIKISNNRHLTFIYVLESKQIKWSAMHIPMHRLLRTTGQVT